MNATTRQSIAAGITGIGLVLLAVGLFLGFGGISKNGVGCGSAFSPSDHDANVAELTGAMDADSSGTAYSSKGFAGDCQDATTSRKTVAVALVIPGAALILAGGLWTMVEVNRPKEPAASAA